MSGKQRSIAFVAGLVVSYVSASNVQANLFSNQGPFIFPSVSNSIPNPAVVPGKEFSANLDRDQNAVPDPHQVLGWDGVNPNYGVGDADDFTPVVGQVGENDIDAIAHNFDALFNPLRDNLVPLVFSTVDSGDIDYELAMSGTMGNWVTAGQVDVMNPPRDLDGLEVWGPSLAPDGGPVDPLRADTNRFSLDADPAIPGAPRVSVFNDDGSIFILHSAIANAVISLVPALAPFSDFVDLDALMVLEDGVDGALGEFDAGDQIMFSIEQVIAPMFTVDHLPTGQEIFVLDASGNVSFLNHGGHRWDIEWALQNPIGDINAIEAVPEPATLVLGVIGVLGLLPRRRTA